MLVISLAISPAQSPIKPLVANRPWQFVIYIKAPTSPRPPPISHLNAAPHRAKTRNGGKHRGGLSQHSDCEPRFHEPHESDSHTSRIPKPRSATKPRLTGGRRNPRIGLPTLKWGLSRPNYTPKTRLLGPFPPKTGLEAPQMPQGLYLGPKSPYPRWEEGPSSPKNRLLTKNLLFF